MEFEYIAVAGPADVDLHLTVRDGIATLVRRPEAPRADGAVIGVFRGAVDPQFLKWLEQSFPVEIPKAGGIRPDSPVVRIKRVWNGQTTDATVAMPSKGAVALQPLMAEVRKQASKLEETSALRVVGVESLGQDGDKWKVRLRNPGSQAVAIDWKGQKPLTVTGLLDGALHDLTAGPIAADAPASIPARSSIEVAVPVKFPKPGSWQVRAVYHVYAGTNPDTAGGPVGGAAGSKFSAITIR